MAKQNCWDFKKCGRQPGGLKTDELGTCPASTETKINGINDGKNGGRACWALTGTLGGGQVQGAFANKLSNCVQCNFYKIVHREQGKNIVNSSQIIKIAQM